MKILVIQQKRIGDVLTSTILCNNLKQYYPDATIDYMCYPNCLDVVLENPNIDNIIVLSNNVRKSYPKFFQFILKMRANKYDAVIDAYCKLETNLITSFSGAKYKISYDKGYSNLFYNHTVKRFPNGTKSELGLAIDNRLLLLKPLIAEKITNFRPKVFLTKNEINEAQELLNKFQIKLSEKPIIMFGILGSEWYKTYPLEKMVKIIDFAVAKFCLITFLLRLMTPKKYMIFVTKKPKKIFILIYMPKDYAHFWDFYPNAICLSETKVVR